MAHNCIYFSDAAWGAREWHFKQGDAEQVISINGDLKVNNVDSIRLAALLGQGLVYLPDFLLNDEFQSGRLVPVLTDFRTPEMPIIAIYPHREFIPSKVRRFIDLVAKEFHDASWNK
jgi:DNA-binding transcriptional LysR family regulator